MDFVINIIISLSPVFLFLIVLIFLDSFKLIKRRSLIFTIMIGAGIALVCYRINIWMLEYIVSSPDSYLRYIAPIVEELSKSLYIVYLIRFQKIGFMVDAAIYGFAIGAGFAFTENIYYLGVLQQASIFLWLIRGFGTAIMHGGNTAIFGVISKNLSDRLSSNASYVYLPGLVLIMIIHSLFNHFLLPPISSTILQLMILPTVFTLVFKQSEQRTREWLGVNLDADMEVLNSLTTGNLSNSHIGEYLQSLKERFAPEVIVDMLCLLRIHIELSIKSKGVLMMREVGFEAPADPEVQEKFAEIEYLEKSIGKTGKMAIHPFMHTSRQSLWQIYMLKK